MTKELEDLLDSLTDEQKQSIVDHIKKQHLSESEERAKAISDATSGWIKEKARNHGDPGDMGGKKIFE